MNIKCDNERPDPVLVVVRHLAVGVAHPVEPRAYFPKCFQPRETILVREINILSPITT